MEGKARETESLDRAGGRLTVVGIDLAAGRGVTALAILHAPLSGWPISLAEMSFPVTDDEIIATVARSGAAIVAIDAPLTLPAPVAAALAGRPPMPGASPYTRAAERDGAWGRLGVRPLPVSFLGGLTLRAIPLAARIRDEAGAPDRPVTIIETFPSAAAVALGLRSTRGGDERGGKATIARRAILQGALSRVVVGLPEVPPQTMGSGAQETMEQFPAPLSADALDALMAALTAAAHALGATIAIGDADEGCIMLPNARPLAIRWPALAALGDPPTWLPS